jgi:hypothetical protein
MGMDYLHLLNFLFMLMTASAPTYIALTIRGSNKRLYYLSVGLAVFAVVHSFYHLAEFLEMGYLGDNFFLPLSVILLVIHGMYYLRSGA